MTFGINDSPLAGRDGKKVQSRVIRKRLMEEAETNVAIHVTDTPSGEAFEVAGRGELQMGVLIENMRREGFELSISRPRVLFKEEDGQRLEPIEEVTVDVDEEYSGVVIEKLTGFRKGDLAEMKSAGCRQDAHHRACAVTRPDRLSRRIHDRHPRHGRFEPRISHLGPAQRCHPRPSSWRFDLHGEWGLCALCHL